MHFSYLTALLPLLSFTIASPVEVRATAPDKAAQVLGNLTALGKGLITLNNTLNTVATNAATISLTTLIAIQDQSNAVGGYITNSTAASNTSSVFTATESKNIYNYGVSITPNISTVLNNFARHKTAFANAGVTSTVISGLQNQRELTREQGNSFKLKLTSPYNTNSTTQTTKILGYFDAAIKTLSS